MAENSTQMPVPLEADTQGLTDDTTIGSATVPDFKMDDFDEQERRLLAEALHESEQHLAMTKLELSRCQAEKDGLQRLLTKERRRHQAVQDELDNVKLRSHHLLLCQGDELAQSVISLSCLAGALSKLYEELQKAADKFSEPVKCVDQKQDVSSDTSVSHNCPGVADTSGDSGIDVSPVEVREVKADSGIKTSEKKGERYVNTQDCCNTGDVDDGRGTGGDGGCTGGDSDVAVTDAIKSDSDSNDSSVNKQTKSGEQEPPQFGSSVGSAFNPIRSRKGEVAPRDVAATEQNGPDLSSLDELPVNKQVDELCNIVALIISALGKVKRGVTASHAKKQAHLRSLESVLSEAHTAHQRELAVLHANVDGSAEVQHQMALKLRLLETELAATREHLSCEEESLMGLRELLQQRTQRLEQLHDQYTYIQRLKQEVDHMTRLSQHKESENAIIAETLESTIAHLEEVKRQEASAASRDTEVNYIRENLGLRKEVSHLKQRLLQTQEDATALTEKAKKRMRTLEMNWRQAESELHRLDQLLEQILQILRNHTDVIKEWDDAALILNEITDTNNKSSDSVD